MRSVAIIVIAFAICTHARATDDSDREALIAQIEVQYAAASVVGADSPFVDMMLAGARPLNPTTSEAIWNDVKAEVAKAMTSALTAKGAGLDVLVRGALDPFSITDLKRLTTLLSDPVFKKFQVSVSSVDIQKRVFQAVMTNSLQMTGAVNAVLEKRGLKVSH
jgi:hypothetical protein